MDRDFDGRLSFGEFMGEETPLEKVFKSMDKDGDGTVTKEVRFNHCILDFIVCIFRSFQRFANTSLNNRSVKDAKKSPYMHPPQ